MGKVMDYMLYGNSKDERVQSKSDKAGHICFLILLPLYGVKMLLNLLEVPFASSVWADVTIVIFFALLYSVIRAASGITPREQGILAKGPWTLLKIIFAAGIAGALVLYIWKGSVLGQDQLIFAMTVSSLTAMASSGVIITIIYFVGKIISNKKLKSDLPEDELN